MTNLVNNWLVLRPIKNSFEILRSEIADADAVQFTLVLQLFEYIPKGSELARLYDIRVMNQEEVRNESESGDRRLNRVGDVFQRNGIAVIWSRNWTSSGIGRIVTMKHTL